MLFVLKVADSYFSENSVLDNFLILKQCLFQLHNFRKKVIKILCHRHWERMGVDPKVLLFLCIFALSVMENR